MTNANVNGNTNANIQGLLALIQGAGYSLDDVAKLAAQRKKVVDNYNYVDDNHEQAICNACGETFDIADVDDVFADECRKKGICPDCARKFAETAQLMAALKSKNLKHAGTKTVINGGQKAGVRFREAFAAAINSPNFTEETLKIFLDPSFSKTLKFADAQPFLADVTDWSEQDFVEKKSWIGRFYAKGYEVLGRKLKLSSQVYNYTIEAANREFAKLGLIDREY